MKKSKEMTVSNIEGPESHGDGYVSTTARSGTYDTISQMSSVGKMTEDSSDPFDCLDEPS